MNEYDLELDLKHMNMRQVFNYWKCDENTQTFTGHAVALYPNDAYLDDCQMTLDCIQRLQMYAWSLARFEKSPYIYPVWGLGGLPEGFSRLAAVHGGVYMLRREIESIDYNAQGRVTGITLTNGEGSATCKQLIADPSYFVNTKKVKKSGCIARWMCILDHAVDGTNKSHSAQIILPTKQTGHRSDIYISVMGSELQVSPKHRWVAMISSYVYTQHPKRELKIAYNLLGKVLKEFFYVSHICSAANNSAEDGIFIVSTMDATTHFQATTKEVINLYESLTGTKVQLNASLDTLNDD